MALDEPKELDKVFKLDGFTYLIDSSLLDQTHPIKVDYLEDNHCSGFAITSKLSNQGCGPCSC